MEIETTNFVLRKGRGGSASRCNSSFSKRPWGIFVKTTGGKDAASQLAFARVGGDVARAYSVTAPRLHSFLLSMHEWINSSHATVTAVATILLRPTVAHFPMDAIQRHLRGGEGWLLVPVSCRIMEHSTGHMFLACLHGKDAYIMDPNGNIQYHGETRHPPSNDTRRESSLEECNEYASCYGKLSEFVQQTVANIFGSATRNLLDGLSVQREASTYLRSHGICMAVVYWVCTVLVLNDSFTPLQLREYLECRRRHFAHEEDAYAHIRRVVSVLRTYPSSRESSIAGLLLLAKKDDDVTARCERLRRVIEKHAAYEEKLSEQSKISVDEYNDNVRKYNSNLGARQREEETIANNMSLEQYLACPAYISKHILLAPEHMDTTNLQLSTAAERETTKIRTHMLGEGINLNFFEMQLLAFMGFVEEYNAAR